MRMPFCFLVVWSVFACGLCAEDSRPTVAIIVSDDHYHADTLLPEWGEKLAREHHVNLLVIHGHGSGNFENMEKLNDADIALLFVRRLALPKTQMAAFRTFLESGKPLLAFRTASHAFQLSFDGKKEAPDGWEQWKTFDADVLGGNYHNHGPNDVPTRVVTLPAAKENPIFQGISLEPWNSTGSLYFTSPVDAKAVVFQIGSIPGHAPEPLTWLRTSPWGGKVLYTGLGHWDDFRDERFTKMVTNAIFYLMEK
ncbi:MAG: ThuA domain-containing protein [Planctomycetia bacterium]|nr:ThuA domain-containing protein [Planctomycetia bacterium]